MDVKGDRAAAFSIILPYNYKDCTTALREKKEIGEGKRIIYRIKGTLF